MSIECNASDTDHDAISHLCRQLGYSGKANYNTYSTGCYVDSIYSYLTKQYFQTKTFEYSNLQSLYSKLDSQACVLSGWVSNLQGGHSWIVDAYIDVNVETVRYTRAFGQKNWNILDRRFKENVKLYHLNLGWNGSANGYYKLGVADLGEYYSGDPNCGGGSNLQYLTDIRVYYFKDK